MMTILHKFVEQIPRDLDDNVIYISIKYGTAIHKCFCGCQQEVVTPLTPTDWKLIYDGKTISLSPSIGNWSYKCQSHYWIKRNQVIWAEKWTDEEIREGRERERINKNRYYGNNKGGYWSKIIKWFSNRN
ncbi:MAG: DUF6527 family protein [bacterium]|nr:DUF6527 family protein [bacterium]